MTFWGRSTEKIFWVLQMGLEALAALAAYLLACHLWIGPVLQWEPEFRITLPGAYLTLLPFIPLIRLFVNWRWGLHETRGALSLVEDFGRAVRVVAIGTVAIICFTFLYRQGFEFSGHSYSRMVFLLDGVFALALLFGVQLIRHRWQRALRARGLNLTPCLLVDTGPQACYLRAQLTDTETWGHRLVAEVSIPGGDHAQTAAMLNELPAIVRHHGVKEVLISDPTITYHELVDVFLASQPGQRFSVQVLPDLRQCIPNKVSWGHIGRIPTLMFLNDPIRGMHFTLKRALDVIVAGTSLLILSPVFLLTALAIRLESPGPVFFRQERVGLDGRKFWLHKFRSMHVNNDAADHQALVKSMINGQAQAHEDENGERVYKIKRDPRITAVGRFIRRYSIDELPQLFNVLTGDMSLVGPRPPIAYEVEEYTTWHRKRLSVRPGITGLWQTMGRSRRTYNQMVKLDIFYINHWSLWLDLLILMRTFRVVLRGSDAC